MKENRFLKPLVGIGCVAALLFVALIGLYLDSQSPDPILGIFPPAETTQVQTESQQQTQPTQDVTSPAPTQSDTAPETTQPGSDPTAEATQPSGEDPTTEPTQPSEKEPTQPSEENPTTRPTQPSEDEPTIEPTQPSADEPTQPSEDAPTTNPTQPSEEEPTIEPTQPSEEEPTTEPTQPSADEPTQPSEDAPTTNPTQPSEEEPTTEPTQPSADEPTQPSEEDPTTRPTAPDEEEPTTEPAGLSLPYFVEGYDLVIEKLAPYEGMYVEDGSNAQDITAAMLMVHNDSDNPVEYTQLTVQCGNETLTFDISALPAGARVVVQEKNGKPMPTGQVQSVNAMVVQKAEMEMSEDTIRVTDNGNNTLTIENLTGKTIPTIRIFYKYYMEDEDIYVGGVAFTVRITRLGAGASVTVQPSHYTSQNSRVVMALTYDSEV